MTGSLSECFTVSEIGLVVCRQDFYVFLMKPYKNHLIHKILTFTFLTGPLEDASYQISSLRERSGSVVECSTREQGAAGLSLIGVTVLCP